MADWERLGRYVVSRRVVLGYRNRVEFAEALHLSLRTVSDIEAGRRAGYQRGTLAALERGLRWQAGSAMAVVSGGEPVVLDSARPSGAASGGSSDLEDELPDDALVRVMKSDLPDPVKARIIRTLLAEQRWFAQRRAQELIAEALSES